MRTSALVILGLLATACGSTAVDAPPPEVSSELPPEPPPVPVPPSYVTAPVVFDLRPLLADLETTIPKKFGSTEQEKRIKVSDGPDVWVAPELERGPLAFTFKDNTVSVSTVLQYRARAWAKVLLFTHSVSCGMKDPSPRLRLRMTVAYDLAPDWTLRTKSHLDELVPMSKEERDQCEISAAKIDVTGKIADAAGGALEGFLKKADQKLQRISLAKPMGGLWATLQRPISISGGMLWLQIQPQAISLGGITAADSNLTARIALLASPRFVSGSRPADGVMPLPALGRGAAGADTALVYIEGTLLYPAATALLGKALVGKSFKVGWRSVRIDSVTAIPGGKGKVILAVGLRGKATGTVYVSGTPQYDPATDLITMPDVGFDVNTTASLGKAVGWLIQGPLLGLIRDNAKIPAADLLDRAMAIANKEINRELSDGIYLRGTLSTADTKGVHASNEALVARAQAQGRLWVEISKEHLLPEKK